MSARESKKVIRPLLEIGTKNF